MKVLILEDEIPAQMQLRRLLSTHYPQAEVVAALDSIESAVAWLGVHQVDLILMDVELSDGVCFEIFSRISISAQVVITTAYEHYALNALKANAVDYLLKPVGDDEFVTAIEKCQSRRPKPVDLTGIEKYLAASQMYKQRFVVKVGDLIIVVNTNDIAYFFSEQKSTYIMTREGKRYLSDLSLDLIEAQVDPKDFFKVSRNCLTRIDAIVSISKHFNSRLRIVLQPAFSENILVSRVRVSAFMDWIEGKS